MGNIANDFGIQVEVADDAPSSFSLETSSKVETQFGVEFPIPTTPPISANVSLGFSDSGSAVIMGDGSTVPRIANLASVIEAIKRLEREGRWKMDNLLVMQVRHLPNAFIAISQSDRTELGLKLSGSVLPSLSDLGKASFDTKVVRERGSIWKAVDAKDVTPIIYTGKLGRKFLGPEFESAALASDTELDFVLDGDPTAVLQRTVVAPGDASATGTIPLITTHNGPNNEPLNFEDISPETLDAQESIAEPDESRSESQLLPPTPAVEVLGTYRQDFQVYEQHTGHLKRIQKIVRAE